MHHVRKSDKTRIVFLFMERLQNANKFIELIIMERNMKSLLLIKPLTFDTKFKIKCERRFEIDKTNKVIGFSSKNCF